MGQLIDRIINFGKSYVNNNSEFQKILDEEDNELKKIIDELNNSNTNSSNSNNYKRQTNSYTNSNSNSNSKFNNQNNSSNYSNRNFNQDKKSNTNFANEKYTKEVYLAFKDLEMEPNDDILIIKTQYKKLIKIYHPDKVNSNNEVNNNLKASKINFSYNILKNYFKF